MAELQRQYARLRPVITAASGWKGHLCRLMPLAQQTRDRAACMRPRPPQDRRAPSCQRCGQQRFCEAAPVHGAADGAGLIVDDKQKPSDKVTCLLTVLPRTSLHSNTHRGARTHDHKVKGLALYRLS